MTRTPRWPSQARLRTGPERVEIELDRVERSRARTARIREDHLRQLIAGGAVEETEMPGPGSTTEDWRARTMSAERAVSAVHPGDHVFVGTACATPRTLVDAIEQRADPPAGVVHPVGEEREVRLRDAREVRIRPTRTGDFRALQDLFYRLPEEDVETRFFQTLTALTDVAAQNLCSVDYEDEMAFAAVLGPPEHERMVATSCYFLDQASGLAEVAYMVDPEWRGAGLASLLHARMAEYARGRGVRGFVAEVMTRNAAMLRVFQRGDHRTDVESSDGSTVVTMLFEARGSAEAP